MMLDDTRCGLDASSLHRTTSMDNYKVEKFGLLSCHRDTSSIARTKQKERAKPKSLRLSPKIYNVMLKLKHLKHQCLTSLEPIASLPLLEFFINSLYSSIESSLHLLTRTIGKITICVILSPT